MRLAVANQKGGVTKTTSSVALAAAYAAGGRTVLLVDLDPQKNATTWLTGGNPEQEWNNDAMAVLTDQAAIADSWVHTTTPGVALIPGTRELYAADRMLGADPGSEQVLRAALDGGPDYDVVIFDCPADLGVLVVSALTAADHVLIPMRPGLLELDALEELVQTVDKVAKRLNPKLGESARSVMLAAFVARQVIDRDVQTKLRTERPAYLMDTVIPASIRAVEAAAHREPLHTFHPGHSVTLAYAAAAAELSRRSTR